MIARNCPFCRTQGLSALPDEGQEWRLVSSRTLERTGDMVLCAGLGALVEPYVLVYPREHFRAVAELPGQRCIDLVTALDCCLASRLFVSGTLAVFEHGGGVDVSEGSMSACLEHCHLHVIDGQFDLQGDLATIFPNAAPVALDRRGAFSAELGYLFAGLYRGEGQITGKIVAKPSCGSQFFRRLLAAKLNLDQWDWRLAPNPNSAAQLVKRWPFPECSRAAGQQ